MKNNQNNPTLYLDIDGVLLPYANPLTQSGFPYEMESLDRSEHYAPEVVKRIGKAGLELVWCTTWGQKEIKNLTESMNELKEGRYITLPSPNDKTLVSQKLNCIIEDQKDNPSPFIWVDDSISLRERTKANQIFADVPHLFINPNRSIGINETELQLIETFAS